MHRAHYWRAQVAALEFCVLSCGGRLGWEGEGSALGAADAAITHQIVDRPMPPERMAAGREYVQPQWVFDCINARGPPRPAAALPLCPC